MRFAALASALLFVATAAPAAEDSLLAAAQGGDVESMLKLGFAYRAGVDGRASNDVAAFTWFSKAADAGNPRGLDNAAFLIEQGRGTRKDLDRARALYRQAADLGNPEAQSNLARCLHEGIGGPQDDAEALRWATAGFHHGQNTHAAITLMDLLLLQDDLRPHRALLEELGETRNPQALFRLAHVYEKGLRGIARDEARAGLYLERARQLGLARDILDDAQLEQLAARTDKAGEFAYLPVGHLDQGYNMCAPTAAAMALGHYLGRAPDPYAIKTNSTGATRPGTGTAWDFLMIGVKTVSGRQWTFRSFPLTDAGFDEGLPVLLAELDAGRPPLIDLGPHTVVLAGYDAAARLAYIQNPAYPWPGVHTVSYDKLRELWHSPWHVSTTRGIEARPVLLTGTSAPPSRSAERPPESGTASP